MYCHEWKNLMKIPTIKRAQNRNINAWGRNNEKTKRVKKKLTSRTKKERKEKNKTIQNNEHHASGGKKERDR